MRSEVKKGTELWTRAKSWTINYHIKTCGRIIFVCFVFTTLLSGFSFPKEVPFTQEDRDRLVRVETKVDVGFQQIDKRFELMDKKFTERFEQVEKRIDDLITFMWILAGAFAGITGVAIGFALWDRRTMIRPFEDKMKETEKRLLRTEEDNRRLIESLRKLAQKDPELREVLKEHGIL